MLVFSVSRCPGEDPPKEHPNYNALNEASVFCQLQGHYDVSMGEPFHFAFEAVRRRFLPGAVYSMTEDLIWF